MEELFDNFLNMFRKEFPWSTDPDGRSRRCTVNLNARTIGGGFADHWALHFDWGDYAATYEANDEDGYLIPKWYKGNPEQHCSFDWRIIQQFKTTCSPQEVNTKARSIPDSGNTYILTRRNCHTWSTELAAKLGIRLEQAIEKHLPKNVCDAIDLGHCVNNLFGEILSPLSSSSLHSGGQSTSASNSEVVSAGRLATAAASCYRNREALALSSRVVEGSRRSTVANSRTATTNQASGDGASMVAAGFAVMASFAFSSFLGNLEDPQTRRKSPQ